MYQVYQVISEEVGRICSKCILKHVLCLTSNRHYLSNFEKYVYDSGPKQAEQRGRILMLRRDRGREGKSCCVYFVVVNLFFLTETLPLTLTHQLYVQPETSTLFNPYYLLAV